MIYNKETYAVNEYIFQNQVTWFCGAELYNLETEEMNCYIGQCVNYGDIIEFLDKYIKELS